MKDIDKIMEMLDWNNSEEIQEEGIKLGKTIKCLDPFVQPVYGGKAVWDNCAKILYDKTDEELKPYLFKIMEWLQDLNWPGALLIQIRLKKYKKDDWFNTVYNLTLKKVRKLDDEMWICWLSELNDKK